MFLLPLYQISVDISLLYCKNLHQDVMEYCIILLCSYYNFLSLSQFFFSFPTKIFFHSLSIHLISQFFYHQGTSQLIWLHFLHIYFATYPKILHRFFYSSGYNLIIPFSHTSIFIHIFKDVKCLACGPLKIFLSTSLYEVIVSMKKSLMYPSIILSTQKLVALNTGLLVLFSC